MPLPAGCLLRSAARGRGSVECKSQPDTFRAQTTCITACAATACAQRAFLLFRARTHCSARRYRLQLAAAATRLCTGPFRFADVSALADGGGVRADGRMGLLPARLAERTLSLLREDARVSADEFGALIRRIRCNAYPLSLDGGGASVGTGIFPVGALLNHSCTPTACAHTRIVREPGAPAHVVLRVRSTSPIGLAQRISIGYIDVLLPDDARRAVLSDAFGFACGCQRCQHGSAGTGAAEPPVDFAHFRCLTCGAALAPANPDGGGGDARDSGRCGGCGELACAADLRRCAAEAAAVVNAAMDVAQQCNVLGGAAAVSDALASSAASRLRVAHPALFDAYLYLAAVCCQPEGKAQLSPARRACLLADVVAACRHRFAGAHVRLAELVLSLSSALELSGDVAEAAAAMAESHGLYVALLGHDHDTSVAVGAMRQRLEIRASSVDCTRATAPKPATPSSCSVVDLEGLD